MLAGELRNKIDNVWNAFWAGAIANPLEVIEQITYLLFMRGLDDVHTLEERKATRFGKPMERRIFPKGKDKIGKDGGIAYEDMRWSRLKNRVGEGWKESSRALEFHIKTQPVGVNVNMLGSSESLMRSRKLHS
jgi:hypothetical protein